MKIALRIVLLLGASAFAACGVQDDRSSLQIDSGKFITAESSNTIPGVLAIDGCTSTAVSDTTLITAGHCVQPGRQVCIRSGSTSNGACTDDVFVPDAWLREDFRQDIAVAVFPVGTFKHYFEVHQAPVSLGQEVLMVGYSDYSIQAADRDKGSKRWGKNQVSRFEPGQVIITNYGFSADKVAVNPGDSGGPMFQGCKLIGVASRTNGYGTFRGKTSLHTNVQYQPNMDFLLSLRSRGAEYCGLPNAKADRCPLSGRAEPVQSGDDFPCSESGSQQNANVHDLYAMVDGSGSSVDFYLAAPRNAETVHMCRGTSATCDDGARIRFTYKKTKDGIRFYQSASKVDLGSAGDTFVAVAAAADGTVTGRSMLRVEK